MHSTIQRNAVFQQLQTQPASLQRKWFTGLSQYIVYSDNSGDLGAVVQHNNAEFGRLDHPELYMGLHGVPATYENADFDRKVTTR